MQPLFRYICLQRFGC